MKKAIVILLSSLLVASLLVGCADKNSSESKDEKKTQQTEQKKPTVSKKFKKLIDSYEDFFNEYIKFMKKYNDSDCPVIDMEEIKANNQRIIEVLNSFGVSISKINATVGPTITLYEITPAEGVRYPYHRAYSGKRNDWNRSAKQKTTNSFYGKLSKF